jgi:hypothetical protein
MLAVVLAIGILLLVFLSSRWVKQCCAAVAGRSLSQC